MLTRKCEQTSEASVRERNIGSRRPAQNDRLETTGLGHSASERVALKGRLGTLFSERPTERRARTNRLGHSLVHTVFSTCSHRVCGRLFISRL